MKLRTITRTMAAAAFLAGSLARADAGSDWTNFGGNEGRNGLSSERGPGTPELLWSGGRPSNIGWQPVTEGRRVFVVRQPGSPGETGDSPIVAMDLDTGAELWATDLPFNEGEWITWIAGVQGGRVFASRSNGETVPAKLYALDAASGGILWESEDAIEAGLYEGVVFAPDGDPILGESSSLRRINAEDGSTDWVSPRQCLISYSCGPAIFGDAVYLLELGISRFDLATGGFQYSSTGDFFGPGQSPPMVGPDGTIYVARTNGPPESNHFHAFEDTGTTITLKWKVLAGRVVSSEFGVGPDGSVYMLGPDKTVDRLDPATGTLRDRSVPVATDFVAHTRIAIDARGRVFVTNGSFIDGRLYAFDADLTPRWDVPVPNVNVGGPALGRDGTLVVCGIGNDVRAYRSTCVDDDGDDICEEDDACPNSIVTPTVVIGACDSGVSNHLLAGGCTFGDLIGQCLEGAARSGQFVSCVARLTNDWRDQGLITGSEKGRIQSCAARFQPRSEALERYQFGQGDHGGSTRSPRGEQEE